MLVRKNRLDLGQPPLTWFEGFVQQFNVSIIDISPEIAIESSYLPGEFHGDPADRMLLATAASHSALLATADKTMIAYGNTGFVRVIACG